MPPLLLRRASARRRHPLTLRPPRRSVTYYAVQSGYKLWGVPFKASERDMASIIYIFYVSKIYEFMDTFIMLQKGNVKQVRACWCQSRLGGVAPHAPSPAQVTLLHVYHHASISFIWWMITYTAPGGDAYFSAALNSFVVRPCALSAPAIRPRPPHLTPAPARSTCSCTPTTCSPSCWARTRRLAALRGGDAASQPLTPPPPQRRDKWLWWGRYLTQFQMLQFLANLVQAWYCERYSPYPRFLSTLLFWYMISLLALFGACAAVLPAARRG